MRKYSSASQTKNSFAQKWTHFHDFQAGLETLDSDTLSWILGHNVIASLTYLANFIATRDRTLDVAYGNERFLNLLTSNANTESSPYGVDSGGEVSDNYKYRP